MMRLRQFAVDIRRLSVEMVARAKASHIGGALSMADILAVLFAPGGRLRFRPGRAGVAASAIDSCSAKGTVAWGCIRRWRCGNFFRSKSLANYGKDGSRLMSHVSHKVPGVEFSTGR